MIWYFVFGVVYMFIRHKAFQDSITTLKEEFIIPEIVSWFIMLIIVVFWPVALLLDFRDKSKT